MAVGAVVSSSILQLYISLYFAQVEYCTKTTFVPSPDVKVTIGVATPLALVTHVVVVVTSPVIVYIESSEDCKSSVTEVVVVYPSVSWKSKLHTS